MLKISFLGDILCQMPFLKAAQQRGNDFYTTFSPIAPILKESDYVVANLETPVAGENAGYSKELYSFNTPTAFLDALRKLKIDLYLTANNHCLDRGLEGLKSTVRELDQRNMAHTGTVGSLYHIAKMGEVTCAFLSYTACINEDKWLKYKNSLSSESINLLIEIDKFLAYRNDNRKKNIPFFELRKKLGNCVSQNFQLKLKEKLGIKLKPTIDNEPLEDVQGAYFSQAESTVKRIKEYADLVFFLPHCGGQFNTKPGNLSQAIFEKLLNTQADAVIGSHPHTIQRCGFLNNKPYVFSLGNVSTSPSYPFLVKSSLPEYGMIYHVYVDNKKIVKTSFSLIKMTEEHDHYPVIYPIEELYDSLENNEKTKISKDVNTICKRVFNNDSDFNVLREYDQGIYDIFNNTKESLK